MNQKIVKLKRSEDMIVDLPEGFGQEGDKVFIKEENGAIVISKPVSIEVDLEDKIFLAIAKMAHERDITFNEMVNIMLTEYLEKCNYSEP